MAEAKFSGVGVVNMNGSVGNTTFARNAYGTYAKMRIGAPAGSLWLAAWQLQVMNFASVWQYGMTDEQRARWYIPSILRKDSLADTNKINGFDLYMSCNLNSYLAGGGGFVVPRLHLLFVPIKSVATNSFTTTQLVLDFVAPANTPIAIYATPGLSPGRMSYTQIYGYVHYYQVGFGALNLFAFYVPRFGVPVSGTKIFVKVVPINPFNGVKGSASYCSGIVA